MPVLTFRPAATRYDQGWCAAIRTMVFVAEQGVPLDEEIDEHEDVCRHILGLADGSPFGTARWRVHGPSTVKIERVAILKAWRGRGSGKDLMTAVMRDIAEAGMSSVTLRLGAQDEAIAFYERLGFAVIGDGFLDAGIPHHMMERPLKGAGQVPTFPG